MDKKTNQCLPINIVVPGDDNLAKKEFGKINNYADVRLEGERI